LHSGSKTAVICSNLSSAGSKSQPARGERSALYHHLVHQHLALPLRRFRSEDFIIQGFATGISGSQQRRGMSVDHGIVKAGAAFFKTIRITTAKNRIMPSQQAVRKRQKRSPPEGGRSVHGCQVRHAPLQAGGATKVAAPKYSEYMYMFNNPLTCTVFVPIFRSRGKRYTSRPSSWLKIFV
jgi:hypothetical protein